MENIIKHAKDYQLESLIMQFRRFRGEVTTNTAEEILLTAIHLATVELEERAKAKVKTDSDDMLREQLGLVIATSKIEP